VERGRGQAGPARDVAGARDGGEPGPYLRALSSKRGDPCRGRRRSDHHRSRRGRDDQGGRSPRGRGLDALRRVEVQGPAVDDGAARRGTPQPGPARAEAGLRRGSAWTTSTGSRGSSRRYVSIA
jgi:hypothetical protein